jgi:hypothetical protein
VRDESQDGVGQIAEIVAANTPNGLSDISIVEHGTASALQLGSSNP